MTFELEVQYASEAGAPLPSEDQIGKWVDAALAGRMEQAQLVVRIVDREESRQLNERYRRRPGATNVLSFPFEQPELLEPPLLGDVVVCAPLVESEAHEQGRAVEAHWAHLVVHGVLHLLGYDHEHDAQAKVMEQTETVILASLGYPDPYRDEAVADEAGGVMRQGSRAQRRSAPAIAGGARQESNEQ